MKKTIFTLCFAIVILNIPSISFAESFYGWWKSVEKQNTAPELLNITDARFSGLKYKIIEKNGDSVKISLQSSPEITKIKIINDNNIIITTVRGANVSYRLITSDTDLTKTDVKKLLSIDDKPVSRPDPF